MEDRLRRPSPCEISADVVFGLFEQIERPHEEGAGLGRVHGKPRLARPVAQPAVGSDAMRGQPIDPGRDRRMAPLALERRRPIEDELRKIVPRVGLCEQRSRRLRLACFGERMRRGAPDAREFGPVERCPGARQQEVAKQRMEAIMGICPGIARGEVIPRREGLEKLARAGVSHEPFGGRRGHRRHESKPHEVALRSRLHALEHLAREVIEQQFARGRPDAREHRRPRPRRLHQEDQPRGPSLGQVDHGLVAGRAAREGYAFRFVVREPQFRRRDDLHCSVDPQPRKSPGRRSAAQHNDVPGLGNLAESSSEDIVDGGIFGDLVVVVEHHRRRIGALEQTPEEVMAEGEDASLIFLRQRRKLAFVGRSARRRFGQPEIEEEGRGFAVALVESEPEWMKAARFGIACNERCFA
jgi:hypothetical protein